MAEPRARQMLTGMRTLCDDACFVFVESTESDTTPFLFQGEPQVNPLPTAEPRDGSDIADLLLISKGSAMPDEDTRYIDG